MLNQLKSAFITLTRLPYIRLADEDFDLKSSLWAFPIVGLVLALILSLFVSLICLVNIPPLIAAILAIFLLVLLTGALHEDGLSDCADAFGASSIERRLEIMRDSQIGTYGTLALIFSISLRSYAVYILWQADDLFYNFLIVLMISRSSMVFVPFFSKPARDNGLASVFKNIDKNQIIISQLIILVVGVFAIGSDIMFMMIAGLVVPSAVAKIADTKIGGFTGDVLGATEQLTQITCFLICLALI